MLRKADAGFWKSGIHSPRWGESLWKVNPMPCVWRSQLLYGVHVAIITEKEGERSVNVSENPVFSLHFILLSPHPPAFPSLIYALLLVFWNHTVLELGSALGAGGWGGSHLRQSLHFTDGEIETQRGQMPGVPGVPSSSKLPFFQPLKVAL